MYTSSLATKREGKHTARRGNIDVRTFSDFKNSRARARGEEGGGGGAVYVR